jgi:hypothetical protein
LDNLLDQGADCRVVEETFDSILTVAGVLKAYYTSPMYKDTASVPPWSWEMSLASNVPPKNSSLAGENSSFVKSKPRPLGDRGDFASAAFYFVMDQVHRHCFFGWIKPLLLTLDLMIFCQLGHLTLVWRGRNG